MFSYQGSCRSFLATALIFYQIPFALSRTFLFFFSVRPLSSRSASSDSLYRLSHQRSLVNNFFHLFSSPSSPSSSALFPPVVPPPRLRQGFDSCGSEFLSSATGAILPPLSGIVNVFSIFYLFQTIHTILTLSHSQNKRLEIWSSLHWTYHIYFCFLIVITLVTAFSHTPNRSDLPHDTTTFPLFHAG